MSKPTAKPNANIMQTMLLMVTIFLGFNLIFNNKNQQGEVLPINQVYARLLDQNAHMRDIDIVSTATEYNHRLDDEVSKKRMDKAVAEEKKIEAVIIEADTQLKGGLFKNDAGRIRSAYQVLVPFEKKLLDSPAWTKAYDVQPCKIYGPAREGRSDTYQGALIAGSVDKFNWTSWSGHDLYQTVVKELSARNKSDYVYGLIPGYQLIDTLVHATGASSGFSYAFAAFLLALVVRAIVFPLSQKQLMFSRQMSQLVPLTNEIKQKYKNDQATQQAKVMELYKEYGINPLAGCFPALIQMPLFLTIYQCMIRYQFEFQKGTFLWINETTSKNTHGFVAPNLGQQDYILIVIYGITMVIATLLTPVTDPTQVKQQRLMGVGVSLIFTFFMFTGAIPVVAGFVLYWTFTNILATTQSLRAYRLPLPPLVKVTAAGGGAVPKAPSKWQQMMDKMMEEQKKQQELLEKQKKQNKDLDFEVKDKKDDNSSDLGDDGQNGKYKPKKRK